MSRRGDDRHRENYHPNNIEHENAGDGTADDGNSDEDGHDGEVDDEEEEKRRGRMRFLSGLVFTVAGGVHATLRCLARTPTFLCLQLTSCGTSSEGSFVIS
ncbi:hypothetical protein TcWFU_004355 [Taenia crassiceps]|uniref:Uncharacterized protein n=1 Tax=Taenia crassiceps TaxID=6207 RepID=A0ABR4QGH9_9CEST